MRTGRLAVRERCHRDAQIFFGVVVFDARFAVGQRRSNEPQLPVGIVMWSRAISLLYALMVELAPGIRPLEVFGPYVMEFLRGGGTPDAVSENGVKVVNRSVPDASKSV